MNKVSVYYPYYDLYADIDDPMEETEALEARREMITSKSWVNIPDQVYISPDYNGIGE